MPSYQDFEWDGGKLGIKRLGIRRLLPFLPYQTGSRPVIKLVLKRTKGKEWPASMCVIVDSIVGDQTVVFDEAVSSIEIGQSWKRSVPLGRTEFPGAYDCRVMLRGVKGNKVTDKAMQHRVLFGVAVAQETTTIWVLGLLGTLVAALVGALVGVLVGAQLE